MTPTSHDVFDNEEVEAFGYDDLWRLRAVYVSKPDPKNPGARLPAKWRERHAYNPAGRNGRPTSAPLDSPVFGQIDNNGDGEADRTFLIIQNHLGDVIKIIEPGGQEEEIRYTLHGEPYIANWLADINRVGSVDGEDIISVYTLWDLGAFGADANGDARVDGDDVIQFLAWWDTGEGAGRTTEDNRCGFRWYTVDMGHRVGQSSGSQGSGAPLHHVEFVFKSGSTQIITVYPR